ncbi:uncharacterized protein LOC120760266 [Hirundo rustica]|uniref:uncharacterized protein LOC120760266 n=1 Tax=Hirundo rustica TaxID=43150 RepID=UPI00267351A8|nr:uncharacterized protein LOC120760266 [Hirundo rustica]
MAPVMQELPLMCLMLLLLCRDPGVGAQLGQGFILQQPQTKVSVAAGETLTLNCTTLETAEPGPLRWLKGWDRGNKTIYDQTRKDPSSRVTRAMNKSKTDFTIHIRNVQPEDTGTYYCVKFVKSYTGVDEVLQRGSGTEVSVLAKPSPPLVSGPEQRAEPGQSVPFTCTTGGFFPKEIGVKWFKNKDPMGALPPQVTEWGVKTYNISSTVMVTLQEDDVRSQLICEVQHPTLLVPLQGRYQLSRVLRVPPSVEVRAEPSPVEVNKTVTFTCLMKEFYPAKVSVSWLENGSEIKVENISQPLELPQGLFELRSQVEVQATEEKNGSTISCVVVHDGRAPANYSAFLWISNPGQGGLSNGFQMYEGANLPSSLLLLLLCILLEKGFLGGILFFLFRRMRRKASEMFPCPAPSQFLDPRVRSQGVATASSDIHQGARPGIPMAPVMQELPLMCLMLLLLCRDPGVGAQLGQGFSLQQPQTKVSVAAGETLTLNCTTSGIASPGPVKWLKGWDRGFQTIYDQKTYRLSHVMRAVAGSNTDFTIHIRNVQPEDTGTYYCVKFVKSYTGVDEVFLHGNGTEVSMQAKPSPPLVSGPEQRAEPGQSVPFTCTTGGFFPKEIGVKWFKNKDPMVAQPPQVTESRVKTYNISSTVMVTLQEDDVRSQLICEVQHPTLLVPLQGRYPLSRVLRVPPSVEVRAEPSPVEVNKTVTFTCLVKKFYPANVSVSWLENGSEIKVENISRPVELHWGLFELRSQVEVQATEEKNGSTISCVVVHDGRAPASYSAFLWTSNPGQGGLSKGFQMYEGANLPSSLLLLLLCILLEKGFFGGILFFLFRRMRRKASEMFPCPALS